MKIVESQCYEKIYVSRKFNFNIQYLSVMVESKCNAENIKFNSFIQIIPINFLMILRKNVSTQYRYSKVLLIQIDLYAYLINFSK